MEAFDRLMADKTVLITSHRLPVIANADRILVMAQGRIVEAGAYAELAALEGDFSRFIREHHGRHDG